MSATRKTKPDASGVREADYYPTPAWAVGAIAERILASRPADRPIIYEPGAGDGAILNALQASGASTVHLRGCEIRDEAAAACRASGYMVWTHDWLKDGPAYTGDIGVMPMNPPYGGRENTAQRFIMAALARLRAGSSVWALLRINWLIDGEATHGRTTWLKCPEGPGLPDIYALNKRPSFTGDGKADATTYAWMHWVVGEHRATSAFHLLECQ